MYGPRYSNPYILVRFTLICSCCKNNYFRLFLLHSCFFIIPCFMESMIGTSSQSIAPHRSDPCLEDSLSLRTATRFDAQGWSRIERATDTVRRGKKPVLLGYGH